MSPTVFAWLQFLLCAALIAVAGRVLAHYGDVIGEKTGLGGTWVGLMLPPVYLLNTFSSTCTAVDAP